MSETSVIWLKVLIIEVAAFPLMCASLVILAKTRIIIVRKTKGTIQQTLELIAAFTWLPAFMSPLLLGAMVGAPHPSGIVRWAFFIWLFALYGLSAITSFFWYMRLRGFLPLQLLHLLRFRPLGQPVHEGLEGCPAFHARPRCGHWVL